MWGAALDRETRVVLRVQRPAGTVKAPEFDEQTLALHAECLGEGGGRGCIRNSAAESPVPERYGA